MYCYAIGGRVNFNYDTISFCHGIDIGDQIIWDVHQNEKFNVEYYQAKVKEYNEKNSNKPEICNGCSNLTNKKNSDGKIRIVTINPNWFCQNRCVYCGNFQSERKELYNPLDIIKEFIDADIIDSNCLFDWGGGEPTVSDCFNEIYIYLLKNGFMQRVNTNSIKVNDVLLNNLDDDLVSLRISLDSGNKETFLRTKGRSLFEQVVNNVKRYRNKTENIILKYVITSTNSDVESIDDFVQLALALDIRTVCIDTEMSSFGRTDYSGLLTFTEKELNAAKYLYSVLKKNKMNIQIGYVWTAQNPDVPSRDFNEITNIKELNNANERYKLPEKLLKIHNERNMDFKSGVYPNVIASWETLLEEIKGKEIFIYGAGNNGKNLIKAFYSNFINYEYIVDEYKHGEILDGKKIINTSEMINHITANSMIIMTPWKSREIIKGFNDLHLTMLKDKVFYIDSFRYSARAIDDLKLLV